VIWVFIFGGIALAGLVMLVAYAIWLAHKASDVFSELRVVARRGGQLAEIAAQIEIPETSERVATPVTPRPARGRRRGGRGSGSGRRRH
jgi:hypothetical protein